MVFSCRADDLISFFLKLLSCCVLKAHLFPYGAPFFLLSAFYDFSCPFPIKCKTLTHVEMKVGTTIAYQFSLC